MKLEKSMYVCKAASQVRCPRRLVAQCRFCTHFRQVLRNPMALAQCQKRSFLSVIIQSSLLCSWCLQSSSWHTRCPGGWKIGVATFVLDAIYRLTPSSVDCSYNGLYVTCDLQIANCMAHLNGVIALRFRVHQWWLINVQKPRCLIVVPGVQ